MLELAGVRVRIPIPLPIILSLKIFIIQILFLKFMWLIVQNFINKSKSQN